MKTFKNILCILFAVALFVPGCSEPEPQESCNFEQNSFGRRVSWKVLPVRFYVDNTADIPEAKFAEIYQGVLDGARAWNEKLGQPAIEIVGRSNDLSQPQISRNDKGETVILPPRDGYNGIYIIPDASGFAGTDGDPHAQARTYLAYQGDYLHQADIAVNGTLSFINTAVDPSGGDRTKIEIGSLMIHEFGHALGLIHIDDSPDGDSVMASQLGNGQVRRTIGDVELDSLACEY